MSGTTSVPPPQFTDRGFIVPPEPDILAGVIADIQAAFAGKLNPNLETPQGQLASTFTAIIGDKDGQFVALANNVDPSYASGRYQDAIGRIYFLTRTPAEPTTVQARCIGLVGAAIPTGALAQSLDDTLYACTEGGTIGLDGSVTLPFAATQTGPIPCSAGTLTRIYQQVPGWDAITNDTDGVTGNAVETRAAFEARRAASVAINAHGSLDTVRAAVLSVPDVIDAYATENNTDSPITSDGVTIGGHSLYVCVAGGDPQEVAQAIFTKKSPGCGMAGDHTEIVEDSNAGYQTPVPTYDITFQIAIPQTFVVLVTLNDNPGVPGAAAALVQAAVLAAFNGLDGGARASIASTIYASRFYAGVAALGTWAQIVSIKLGSTGSPSARFTASIAAGVMTVTAVASGSIAVGHTVVAPGLADGVRIISAGTGVGGTGTYNLSLSATLASEDMATVLATLDRIDVGIAHVPVLGAPNIRVALV